MCPAGRNTNMPKIRRFFPAQRRSSEASNFNRIYPHLKSNLWGLKISVSSVGTDLARAEVETKTGI